MENKIYVKPEIVSHKTIAFETAVSGEQIFKGQGNGVGGKPSDGFGTKPGKGKR